MIGSRLLFFLVSSWILAESTLSFQAVSNSGAFKLRIMNGTTNQSSLIYMTVNISDLGIQSDHGYWAGFGLNDSPKMKGSDVTVCNSNSSGHTIVSRYFIDSYTSVVPRNITLGQCGIYGYSAVMKDDIITCGLVRSHIYPSENYNLSLPGYLIFAAGPIDSSRNILKHTIVEISDHKVNFQDTNQPANLVARRSYLNSEYALIERLLIILVLIICLF